MVWFRADPGHNDVCRARLAALGQRMRQAWGVEARCGWRDEAGAGYRTWLETYEALGAGQCDAFIDALRSGAAALGLDRGEVDCDGDGIQNAITAISILLHRAEERLLADLARQLVDLIDVDHVHRLVEQVHDVVEEVGQGVDVLAVERCHEGAVSKNWQS